MLGALAWQVKNPNKNISFCVFWGEIARGVFVPRGLPILASASYAFSFSSTTTTITFSAHTIFSAMDKNTTQRSFSSTPSVSLIVRIDVNRENRQKEETRSGGSA